MQSPKSPLHFHAPLFPFFFSASPGSSLQGAGPIPLTLAVPPGGRGAGGPPSHGVLLLGCWQRGGNGEAVGSSRLASELETSKTLAGDTCIRCSETITKPA